MRRRVEGCGVCVKCVRCCGVSGWRQGGATKPGVRLRFRAPEGSTMAAPDASSQPRDTSTAGLRFPAARSPLFQGVDGAHARVSWVGSDVIGSAKATMLR